MEKFKFSILFFISCFFISCAYSNNLNYEKDQSSFKFEDYLIDVEQNKTYSSLPNFADHYFVRIYGCGGGAICGDIKDLITNRIIGFPNAYLIEDDNGENGFSITYHLNSSLIIISGIVADPEQYIDKKIFNKRFYNLIDEQLILLSVE